MIVLKRLVLALLPAVLFGLYAHWPALASLGLVTLVPWIVLYTDDRHPRVSWGYYLLGAFAALVALNAEAFRFGWYAALGVDYIHSSAWSFFFRSEYVSGGYGYRTIGLEGDSLDSPLGSEIFSLTLGLSYRIPAW